MAGFRNLFGTGIIMSETDPLNHKWLDSAIHLGLALHQLKKMLLKHFYEYHTEKLKYRDLKCLILKVLP
jgi:hypothetical protein